MNVKKKNNTLYLWEGIACIMVIFIHCRFPGSIGTIAETIARFAVPMFFAVSGYFWYGSVGKGNVKTLVKKKILKMFKIFFVAFLIYFAYKALLCVISGENTLSAISMNDIMKMLIFNDTSFICMPLWFLLALMYCYIVFGIIERLNLYKILPFITILLLTIHYIMRVMFDVIKVDAINEIFSSECLYRNWLLMGIPFFSLGYLINYRKDNIERNVKPIISFLLIICGCFLSIAERMMFSMEFEFYIGSVLIVFGVFALSIAKPDITKFNIQYIGENCILPIYILHPLVMYILRIMFNKIFSSQEAVIQWLLPIMVMVVTVGAAILYSEIMKTVAKRKRD